MTQTHADKGVNRRTSQRTVAVGFALAAGLAVTAAAADLELVIGGFVGGGGRSAVGDLSLIGSIGDPAAGTTTGETLVLSGGVLAGGGDGTLIFTDGFEGGAVANWSNSQSGDEQ